MSDVNIRPLHDRVIIEPIETRKTESGIVIPDTAENKSQRGKVVAVGPGKTTDAGVRQLDVKVGDEVIYPKYSGTELKMGSRNILVMREEDIMGIIC